MELSRSGRLEVEGVGVQLAGALLRAEVRRGASAVGVRGVRGADAVGDLLASSGFRLAAAIDIDVLEVDPGAARGAAVTPTGTAPTPSSAAATAAEAIDVNAEIVLDGPPLLADEACHVLLVEEDGELRWIFGDAGNRFVIPVEAMAAPRQRGFIGSQLRKAVKFLAVKAIKPLAQGGIRSLARAAEERRRPHRLRTFGPGDYNRPDAAVPDFEHLAGGPALLFLHGTNSLTHSGFGRLDPGWVRQVHERYDGRVFGFDHPTLSVSPTDNARVFLDMVNALLPAGSALVLDVLAHSRGGLVARELVERTTAPNIGARSVTFVATPSNGTPLCDSSHLGDLVDALTNLAAVIPDNPVTDALEVIFELVKDIALDIAYDALPGVQAMNPSGAYLGDLNAIGRPDGVVYRAIASNFEPLSTAGMLMKLRDRLTDRVFGGTMNDLIVPTRSAYLQRDRFSVPADQRVVLDSSYAVNHSTFWSDPTALARLETWLRPDWPEQPPLPVPPAASDANADVEAALAVADDRGLASAASALRRLPKQFLEALGQLTAGPVAEPPAGGRDAVVVLPGIMGSLLSIGDTSIWVSPRALFNGGFGKLRLGRGEREVTAVGLHATYGALVARLAATRDVYLFPYDWRRSVSDAARLLDRFIRTRVFVAGAPRPVHLVAHSMGGLVARSFIAQFQASTWADVDDAAGHARGGRLLMLGTPNRGSHAIGLALAGEDLLVKGVFSVDRVHDREEITSILATFPGVCELLPAPDLEVDDDHRALYDPASWRPGLLEAAILEEAAAVHASLGEVRDPHRLVYVAGDGHLTPARVRVDGGRLHFGSHDRGDGRVTHEAGILPGVTTYYSAASHGGLVNDPDVLEAVDELLALGATDRLAIAAKPRRGLAARPEPVTFVPAAQVDPEPLIGGTTRGEPSPPRSGRELEAALSQATSMYLGTTAEPVGAGRSLRVTVTHASLEQAAHPVVVGHYQGIPAEGAEAFLDSRLGGALGRHLLVGDYPRAVGDVLFVEVPNRVPPGGIVIGLGEFGELTRAKLVRAVRRAAVQRALRAAEQPRDGGPIGISAVLVSTPGSYGLSVESSVAALVEGVARALLDLGEADGSEATIEELEIIELYEVRATEAVNAAVRIHELLPVEVRSAIDLRVTGDLGTGRGGRPGLPSYNTSGDAWPRILIDHRPPLAPATADVAAGAPTAARPGPTTLSQLEFTRLGRGAQVDRLLVDYDAEKVRRIIEVAVRRPDAVAEAVALFELLFPHEAKLEVSDTDNLHLLVDEQTAAIPWELVSGRTTGHAFDALALRTGMLRQLRPGSGGDPVRRVSQPPVDRYALVVGDPPLGPGFPRLPGARREAAEVAQLLEQHGYVVDRLIFDDDDEPDAWLRVQTMLVRRAYRVLHFATHGEVDPVQPERSGLLIGPDVRLTAVDFRQMSATPDFVFLNACHVGRTGTVGAAARGGERLNELAANLALQLMRNGVRAVVAAGWAVDDRAASMFARGLYEQLLAGGRYGDTVRVARSAAFDGGRTNTWGAYQCYGDPSFSLQPSDRGTSPPRPVSARDLIRRLEEVAVRAADAADLDELVRLHQQVRTLDQAEVHRFGRVEVFEVFGRAYGELGSYADAVWAYARAEELDDGLGRTALIALEQLSNMESRLAVNLALHRSQPLPPVHPASERSTALFRRALDRLQRLNRFEETSERWSLIGSLYKKQAVTRAVARREAVIARSRDAYRTAHELHVARTGRADPYSTNLWLQLSAIAAEPDAPETTAALELLERDVAEREARARASDFWSDSRRADLALTKAIRHPAVGFDEARQGYLEAFRNRSSCRERNSVLEHLGELALLVQPDRRSAIDRLMEDLDDRPAAGP